VTGLEALGIFRFFVPEKLHSKYVEYSKTVKLLRMLRMLRIPHCLDSRQSAIGSQLTARYWLLVAVLTVQFVPHRKHTPSP
jgi:hypothetical protein